MVIMKSSCIFLLLIGIASPESLPRRSLKSIPVLDALVQRLEREPWPDDAACYRDTLQILYEVRNDTLWATWVWDSIQPPMGVFYGTGMHLGNFDQCLNVPPQGVNTQYCLVDVKVQKPRTTRDFGVYDGADEYLNTLTPPGRTLNHLLIGACMPVVCSPSSVSRFYRHVLKMTHLPDAEEITVDPTNCQNSLPKPYPGKFYAYLSVFGVLLVTVVVSTIYTHYKDTSEHSRIDAIAKSFCLTHNWSDLFKVNTNEIKVLNGMRVITALLVIGCHQGLFSLWLPSYLTNTVEIDVMFQNNEIGHGLTHIDLIVDTFFAISGLLLVRGLLGGRQKNLIVVLIKRYFRLIGPYAATTFYIMCIARHTGSGPFWLLANANEEGVCEKHWWKNILMMVYDMRTMCYGVAWYVTCDYHLAILTVLLFWIYRRHRQTGITAFIVISIGLTTQLAIKAYVRGLPLALFGSIVEISDIREHKMMNEMYIRWYDRAGSYLVGAAMGALMTVYKPAEHRNVINKTRSFFLLLASLFVMTKVATISYWFSGGPLAAAAAVAMNRSVWAVAVCCVIGVCEYGNSGFVSDFLGSAAFVPISKLCYGIYMSHFFIVQRNLHVTRTAYKFDIFNLIISTQGTMALACVTALVLHLLVEAPCINLSNVFLSEKTEITKVNGAKPKKSKHINGTNGVLNEKRNNGIEKSKTS